MRVYPRLHNPSARRPVGTESPINRALQLLPTSQNHSFSEETLHKFAKKLKERLELPRVEVDRLKGISDCYKVKVRSVGYRLVYEVVDQRLVVTMIAVGKRERSEVYDTARKRLAQRLGPLELSLNVRSPDCMRMGIASLA